jgi:hypothetical protein
MSMNVPMKVEGRPDPSNSTGRPRASNQVSAATEGSTRISISALSSVSPDAPNPSNAALASASIQ